MAVGRERRRQFRRGGWGRANRSRPSNVRRHARRDFPTNVLCSIQALSVSGIGAGGGLAPPPPQLGVTQDTWNCGDTE
ncbi:MAG: hypothetical protein GY820_27635 [Gammaproteobacteria bacterium]|nr:hypothetical protein [Gammaproteobacteria bacterium]